MFNAVYITFPNEDEAVRISKALISEKLIACANYFSIKSIYEWNNEIVHDDEVALICKTRKGLFDDLVNKVVELHPYDIPCIVAFPIENGYNEYLSWIEQSTK